MMQNLGLEMSERFSKMGQCCLFVSSLLLAGTGCGSGGTTTDNSTAAAAPRSYFAPFVYNTTNGGPSSVLPGPYIYEFDDILHTFSQSTFQIASPQRGPQTINAGVAPVVQRGLLSLGTTVNYVAGGTGFVGTQLKQPYPQGFAVEFANQAGGFVQLKGQPASPLGAAVQCPVAKTAQSYLFISLPGSLMHAGTQSVQAPLWDPAQSTAYGSVDMTSDGTNVTFANIQQHTLPMAAGSGLPALAAPASATGICATSVFGNTISVPGELITKDPGTSTGVTPPQASISIGPTGMLVEHNGAALSGSAAGTFENALGAGSGAVGIPKPSSPVDVNALRSAQYLGFVVGAGTFTSTGAATGWSSHLASFGFASMPSACASVATSTSTILYGGDFTNDDPSKSSDGFGNCDLAIDFGAQDSATNGLFPNAKVWIGAAYAGNSLGASSFSAVAIAGQLNGKNVVLVIGADTQQPWSIYLVQSN